jgi:hypothetical protein
MLDEGELENRAMLDACVAWAVCYVRFEELCDQELVFTCLMVHAPSTFVWK